MNKSGFRYLILLIVLITTLTPVAAAELYFSAGLPINYTFDSKNSDGRSFTTDKVTGRILRAQFTTLFGVGYESFEILLKNPDYTLYDQKVLFTIYDIFYVLPIPTIIITVGAGTGVSRMDCSNCSDYFNEGQITQLFLQGGYALSSMMDIHLSYHKIYSKLTAKVSDFEANLNGSALSLGVGFSF